MKVSKLIEELLKMPQDHEVQLWSPDRDDLWDWEPVQSIYVGEGEKEVRLSVHDRP